MANPHLLKSVINWIGLAVALVNAVFLGNKSEIERARFWSLAYLALGFAAISIGIVFLLSHPRLIISHFAKMGENLSK